MKQSNIHRIFKALSNEQRLKIFLMIYERCHDGSEFKPPAARPCCEGMLAKAFTKACTCMSLSRSTISHHFKELQNAGLIDCQRSGNTFNCKVNEEAVKLIKDFLK